MYTVCNLGHERYSIVHNGPVCYVSDYDAAVKIADMLNRANADSVILCDSHEVAWYPSGVVSVHVSGTCNTCGHAMAIEQLSSDRKPRIYHYGMCSKDPAHVAPVFVAREYVEC